MGKIVKTATEAYEIKTKVAFSNRIITIVDGKIVRVICSVREGDGVYWIRDDTDLQFDDTSEEEPIKDDTDLQSDDTSDEEPKERYRYGRIKYTNSDGQSEHYWVRRRSASEFEEQCRREIEVIAKFNLKELKSLYMALTDVPMKEYCRELQIRILTLLNF